mmetsp:Transcript_13945/g.23180  ORF Transcript_13945/g.23180 Transcript_13945/m.23180 type:complete len:215 (-) Transcript_13945:57-701(-)|eukprot:CAMPEP_0119013876 /NCGR_PEP_ID=MMETSP1176-20130426/9162_1 /TAXON_ID=265551 /ORGANISM="Synedropsis recta cf, Strain CCMP1620" /LENGTH=214 /DNA_ID=CAMNT_0006967003 /DNA_START=70 /DNA_END=714 /DNA_ORIENTATION=+
MIKASLLLLASLSLVAAINTNDFFEQVELTEYDDGDELNEFGYDRIFDSNFTVTVFGVPETTAGGQNDLKKFGKYFLKKFNAVQNKIERKEANADGTTVEEPGILMFDTEVTGQYISQVDGTDVWYNSLDVAASLVCVEEECPDSVDDETRRLSNNKQRRLVSVANSIRNKLLNSGRPYFAEVTCVKVMSSLATDFVDVSKGCEAYPDEVEHSA